MALRTISPMLTCFGLSRCLTNCKHPDTKSVTYDVKEPYADYSEGDLENTMKKAQSFVDIIVAADCDRKDAHFRKALRGSISAASWTENLAKAILTKLESIIQNKNKIGQTLRDTIQKAVVAAFEFAKNHPVYTTIIVLGVLVEIAPWVLTALGFAEGGIVEGSWAAVWQARYAGYVPKGSLFSYLQRLGMTLKWKI